METISKVYLVMEVAPVGEMYTHISLTGRYDESLAKNLYSQLISAVEFMVRESKINIFLKSSFFKISAFCFFLRKARERFVPSRHKSGECVSLIG